MSRTTVSTKGQVVIPKGLRDRRGWIPGTALELEELEHGVLLRKVQEFPQTHVDDLLGCVAYDGPAKTLQEMEQAIAEGAQEQR